MAFINHFEGKETVIIAGRYDGTGTASITSGKGFSVVDGGTGTYTVTFHRAFDNLVAVTANGLTANQNIHIGTITHTDGTNGPSIVFQGNNDADGVDTDTDFSFITIWEIDT